MEGGCHSVSLVPPQTVGNWSGVALYSVWSAVMWQSCGHNQVHKDVTIPDNEQHCKSQQLCLSLPLICGRDLQWSAHTTGCWNTCTWHVDRELQTDMCGQHHMVKGDQNKCSCDRDTSYHKRYRIIKQQRLHNQQHAVTGVWTACWVDS